MLRLNNNNLYTGITNNLDKRLKQHKLGRGSKCVRSFRPFTLVWIKLATNRSEASKIEYRIKQLTGQQKEQLIKGEKDYDI